MNEIKEIAIILFKLPDGRIVLQRRTKDAPYAPGKLGIFGGWVEPGEVVGECMTREIKEETSLDIAKLNLKQITDFVIPKGADFPEDRRFYLFTGDIDSLDFEVYEGDRAEAITLDDANNLDDLAGSAVYTFRHVLPTVSF